MVVEAKRYVFMEFCKSCKRKHRMTMQRCPSCGGRGGWIPQPVSSAVYDSCGASYKCDGCEAYEDHLR